MKKQREMALSDAKDALDELKMQHQFDLSTQALDKFIVDLESTLDDSAQTIDETFEKFLEGLQSILEVARNADVNGPYNKILKNVVGVNTDAGSLPSSPLANSGGNAGVSNAVPGMQNSGYTPISRSDFLDSISTLETNIMQMFAPGQTIIGNTVIDMNSMISEINDNIAYIANTLSSSQPVDVNLHFDNNITINGGLANGTAINEMKGVLEQNYQYTRDKLFNELRSIGIVRR